MLRVAQHINSHVAQRAHALRSYLLLDAVLRKHIVVVVVVAIVARRNYAEKSMRP